MPARSLLKAILVALFLAGLAGTVFAGDGHKKKKKPQPPRLVQVTYPVADLVVPVDMTGEGKTLSTRENELMDLLRKTVAPESWADYGGSGKLEYFSTGMALVVRQTQDVQEQIQDILAALRRLQDLEVAVDVRLVCVTDDMLRRLFSKLDECPASGRPITLGDLEVQRLCAAAERHGRGSVIKAPKITVFNGQRAGLNVYDQRCFVSGLEVVQETDRVVIRPKKEYIPIGLTSHILPVVAADRRSVRMSVDLKLTQLDSPGKPLPVTVAVTDRKEDGREEQVPVQAIERPEVTTLALVQDFAVPDGGTAVLYLGKKIPAAAGALPQPSTPITRVSHVENRRAPLQHVLVLITPRIIINEQEEQIFLGEIPSRSDD